MLYLEHKRNLEKAREYRKRWYKDNKEKEIQQAKQWAIDNPDKVERIQRRYREKNKKKIKEKIVKYNKQYRQTTIFKENNRKHQKQYRQTIRGKITKKKYRAQRKDLGFLPLNEPFEGCEGHHISKNFVIFIPVELHQCLYHNIWTWQNMEEMNKLAIGYL